MPPITISTKTTLSQPTSSTLITTTTSRATVTTSTATTSTVSQSSAPPTTTSVPDNSAVLALIEQIIEDYDAWREAAVDWLEADDSGDISAAVRRSVSRLAKREDIPFQVLRNRGKRVADEFDNADSVVDSAEASNSISPAQASKYRSIRSSFNRNYALLGSISSSGSSAVNRATGTQLLTGLFIDLALIGVLIGVLVADGGGSQPTKSYTAPASPTVTQSGTPTPALVLLTESASRTDFDNIVVELQKDGAVVIDQITDDDISFYALYGDLYEKNFLDLDGNPLVSTISPDNEFEVSDTIETASGAAARAVPPANESYIGDVGGLDKRTLPQDAIFEIGKVEGAIGFPFHLRWLNSLWAKNAWEGVFLDTPDYFWDDSLPSGNPPIYLLDSGCDMTHEEITNGIIKEAHDYTRTRDLGFDGIRDPSGHGTQMASVIGGRFNGVNKKASIICLGIQGDESEVNAGYKNIYLWRAVKGIIKMQKQKGNPTAIVSISQAAPREDFQKGIFARLRKNTDPFKEFLERIYKANVHVVASVTNYGFDAAPKGNIDWTTPQWLGGADTPLIEVGNCDENGRRYDTSSYLRADTSKEYISLYVMGKQIPVPLQQTGNKYVKASGASASAAITSGLLSLLIAQGIHVGAPKDGIAKAVLRDVALERKGQAGWPTTDEGYFVPRAATNWEIECDEGPEQDPVVAPFVTNLPNVFEVTTTTMPYAEYTGSFAPSCLVVTSRPTPSVSRPQFKPSTDETSTSTSTSTSTTAAAETGTETPAESSIETTAEVTTPATGAEEASTATPTPEASTAVATPAPTSNSETAAPTVGQVGSPSS
ncbi:pathogenicity protein [Purpureocillium lavendulum]|uniref:Pathogenicity protein n=1 Tax=Purpureocillium lavendulum TaxID=1247861 RepID=A0AB34FK45_9HYPO|nr:pathogenicity protein [Purpureocillium lavendulum]